PFYSVARSRCVYRDRRAERRFNQGPPGADRGQKLALAARYVEKFGAGVRPRQREVVQFLSRDKGFGRARSKYFDQLWVAEWLNEPQRMQPVGAAAGWDVPPIESAGALAEWLGLEIGDLLWVAVSQGAG